MIFFFDYLYMQCCDLYRRDKIERASGSWRGSGMIMVAGSTALVIGLINLVVFEFFFKPEILHNGESTDDGIFYLKAIAIGAFVVCLIIFGIRYKKYITYEQVITKVRKLNKIQRIILNILVGIYLFTALPLFIFCAWYFSP